MTSLFSLSVRRRQTLTLGFCLVISLALDAISSPREAHLSCLSRPCHPPALLGSCGNSFTVPIRVLLPNSFQGRLGVGRVSMANKHLSAISEMLCIGVLAFAVDSDSGGGPLTSSVWLGVGRCLAGSPDLQGGRTRNWVSWCRDRTCFSDGGGCFCC